MKLLFDENLSPRLADLLADLFPGSEHLEQVGLGGAADLQIRRYAQEHGFLIVSKDADFANISVLRGAPPKVLWIRAGNRTIVLAEFLLRNSVRAIERFANNSESCLILGRRAK